MKRILGVALAGLLASSARSGPTGKSYAFLHQQAGRHAVIVIYRDQGYHGNNHNPEGWMGCIACMTLDVASTVQPWSGTTCVRVTFDPDGGEGWGGMAWVGAHLDLLDADWIKVRVRGQDGGEQVALGIGGGPGDSLKDKQTPYFTLGTHWKTRKIKVPKGADLTQVGRTVYWVANDQHNDDEIAFWLDAIEYGGVLEKPRMIESYVVLSEDAPDAWLANQGFVYDTALAIVALAARGKPKDLVVAEAMGRGILLAMEHDPNGLGVPRASYRADDLLCTRTMCGAPEAMPLDPTVSTGNVAWAGLSLVTLHEATGDPAYLSGAEDLAAWIRANTRSTSGFGGYTGGLAADGSPVSFKSTEHVIDVYALMARLYDLTGDGQYEADAIHAKDFLRHPEIWLGDHFAVGTKMEMGVEVVNQDVDALDANAWGMLALGAAYETRPWIDANLAVAAGGFEGFDFNDDRDGIWCEGTAQYACVERIFGGDDFYLDQLEEIRKSGPSADGRGLIAAIPDGVTTGFLDGSGNPILYYSRLHVGATAWYVFARLGWNPFWGTTDAVDPHEDW